MHDSASTAHEDNGAHIDHERQRSRLSQRAETHLQALRDIFVDEPIDVSFRHLTGPLPADDLTHSIYPYPARLVRHIPRLLTRAPQIVGSSTTILDPFCGSGTVLLEAMSAGVRSIGIDANPLATLVSSVKTTPLDPAQLQEAAVRLVDVSRRRRRGPPPAAFLERWYSPSALVAMTKLSGSARALDASPTSQALRLAVALTARAASITDKRIPVPVRPHQAVQAASNLDVWRIFADRVQRIATRTARLRPAWPRPDVILGDSRSLSLWDELADLDDICVMTSPPYGAAQKYVRSTSLELGWLGWTNGRGTAVLERSSIGREHLGSGDRSPDLAVLDESTQAQVRRIEAVNPLRGDIYGNYFLDMLTVFSEMSERLTGLKRFVLVAGDNSVLGSNVPTHEHLARSIERLGFEKRMVLRDSIRGRSLLSSRMNTGSPARSEFIYWFER